ncbi:MAG: 1-(5-phosphoribosyl)-5-[(5-phosphoribosylamino)methylideneamino]imidazole-4-carboxamide isomerase [Candidatus Omnitrophica bacterium]|nr:1-(5-phosphoribosyl)-5-[(5-phosphoribosylamino)methylideneamino]imidazole-4-carboxamide isomerase [Candidatus Omnitrophota bacterium]
MDKKVVRLLRGSSQKKTIYSDDPVEVAGRFQSQGARLVHLVDLDAAFGQGNNFESIKEVVASLNIDVQVGGGIRTPEYAHKLIDAGVKRIVVSTKAIQNSRFLNLLYQSFADRLVISLDVRNGKLAIEGWRQSSCQEPLPFIREQERKGLKWLVYTDISRDGTLEGLNFKAIKALKEETSIGIIASGGVASLEDIKKANSLGVWGVIVGKALYEEKFTLKEALKTLS